MTWLVTGGAGYIGGHVVRGLQAAGQRVVVLDDLSNGSACRVPLGVPLIVADVADPRAVRAVIRAHAVSGVVHLAARKSVSESVRRPAFYYRENVGGLLSVLAAMSDTGVDRLVFASSAAVYGAPAGPVVAETAAVLPMNPYGHSKLTGERILAAIGDHEGLSWVALRCFNVVGTASAALVDRHGDNVLPRLIEAADTGQVFTIAGGDHSTRDGTGVRDYVHVVDVAAAFAAAALRLSTGPSLRIVLNVGSGQGYSVLELIDCVELVTGRRVRYRVGPARPGDPPEVTADPALIGRTLRWQARHRLPDMAGSAWRGRTPGADPIRPPEPNLPLQITHRGTVVLGGSHLPETSRPRQMDWRTTWTSSL
ncbi:MAG TPA: UDP-glucose 4-epimerase GalE [Kineosporiaceae bacterium]|nr:UDP-glucose 4-epimerase GalE [Kineosporiaceae bacterium]